MDLINKEIIESMKVLNENLKNKLSYLDNLNKKEIRKKLSDNGDFATINKLSKDQLSKYKNTACVDGSVNRYGGSYPHYIDLFQGLGKISGEKVFNECKVYINSPLLSNLESDEDLRKKYLAKIEVEVALSILDNYDIKLLLMDGNLIRYNIEAPETFNLLKEKALEKNTYLAGFIKESKSNNLSNLFFEEIDFQVYDKDLLYGVFDIGEGYVLSENLNKKVSQGFASMFLRTSNYPGISGLEVIYEQRDRLVEIASLLYSLTSKMSRGVPMIIDIVDKEAKLDDKLVEELIKSYIDKDIVERFFRSERSMRKYWGEFY